jgi:Protein of unknown function (DUF1564)
MADGESLLLASESLVDSQSSRSAPATLLAPAALLENIQRRAGARHKGGYLRYLLGRYRSEFENLNRDGRLTDRTSYQSGGLNLIRISLRPYSGDWLELSVLARSIGCSRCKLFIMLCELDLEREDAPGEKDGVPTNPIREQLYQEAASVLLIEEVFPGRRRHKRRLEILRDERLYIQLVHGPLAAAKYELTGVLDLNYSFNFRDFWPNFRKGERP